jgi:hypothetical protein
MTGLESPQSSFWDVHMFVDPWIEAVPDWPLLGSPAWCALDSTEPAKWAALLDAAQHWALRLETCQAARAEASRAIAAAADWSAGARWIQRGRGSAYVPRRLAGVA